MSKYDELNELDTLEEVEKFNPYHDSLGRFASGNGLGHFAPLQGKTPNGQKLLEQYKEKHGWKKPGGGDEKKPVSPGKQADTTRPPEGTRTQTDHLDGHHEGVDGVKKITGAEGEEAKSMADAVVDFTDGWFGAIRQAGFEGSPPASAAAKEKADQVDKLVDKGAKFDGQVYRGIGVDGATADAIVDMARRGELINQKGAASFSTSENTARSFGTSNCPHDGTVVMFRSKGVQNGTSVKNISDFPSEDEVLMSSKARWKPIGVIETTIGGHRAFIVDCEPYWGSDGDFKPEAIPF
jgi:hypothetical protein